MHLITVSSHDMDLKDAASTRESLVAQCQTHGPANLRQDAQERMSLIKELRQRLREYHETLLLQSQVAQLKHPENRVLAAVKHIFERPHHILEGKAKTFLNNPRDLVALKTPVEADYLSNLLKHHWISRKEVTRDGLSRFARFDKRSTILTVNLVTIAVAAIFLIGPILALDLARDRAAKLATVSRFIASSASGISLITSAKRAETFAATAAYAAVLVVFVNNDELSPASASSWTGMFRVCLDFGRCVRKMTRRVR